ncbi:3-phosphoshikimate 1-carboxyvinyltransferase [Staphylospora marina]|uniref:3-phosphoshikimate 1-carboxyvinyltransferase n=1 Tax=Staphylospora marina TaxID=2490858 RepID=UPI000F5C2148|nr:3-phosphoshikimate 1-carboxyvinyltransferase [Staphylospora marina]
MLIVNRPRPFDLVLAVPGDKSVSHRAVMLGALAEGTSEIEGFLPGDDCLSTVRCFRQMGVEIEQVTETVLKVTGQGPEGLREPGDVLDVGNSGTTLRLLLGILAGLPFFSTVTGDASIRRRPMGRVVEPLRKMGAFIDGRNGGRLAPIAVRGGQLRGIEHESPVASAQVKSCLLLAGLFADGETVIREPARSRDHTERMLTAFGAEVETEERGVRIRGGQRLQATKVTVPGDISSAAFLWAAALMVPGSRVTVKNVGLNPTRTGILDVFRLMGAEVTVEEIKEYGGEPVGTVTVSGGRGLAGAEIGGGLIPRLIDELPVLAVLATQAEGTTVIRDAEELRVKETDRIETLAGELRKLGARVETTADGMIIEGPVTLRGGSVSGHGDHRLAMALSVAGLASRDPVSVSRTEAIRVSYPGFEQALAWMMDG